MRGKHPAPHLTVPLINHQSVAIEHLHLGMAGEIRRHVAHHARHQQVVRIQPGHDVTVRLGKPAIDRAGRPVIWSGFPAGKTGGHLLNHRHRSVPAAAIHHPILQERVVLLQHAHQRSLQKGRLLKRRGNHRHTRPAVTLPWRPRFRQTAHLKRTRLMLTQHAQPHGITPDSAPILLKPPPGSIVLRCFQRRTSWQGQTLLQRCPQMIPLLVQHAIPSRQILQFMPRGTGLLTQPFDLFLEGLML